MKYPCHYAECDFATNWYSHLDGHIRTVHLKEKRSVCHRCGYATAWKGSFNRHMKQRHGETPVVDGRRNRAKTGVVLCRLPQYEKSKPAAKRSGRRRLVKQYVCCECDYETTRNSAFEQHLELAHCESPTMKETVAFESPSPRHRETMKQRIERFFAKKRASAATDTHACKPVLQVIDEEDQLNRSFVEQALNDALHRQVWRMPDCYVDIRL